MKDDEQFKTVSEDQIQALGFKPLGLGSLGLGWGQVETTEDYLLKVFRVEPQMSKGTKISGFLKDYHLPITIPSIIEDIGRIHGGGKFQLRIVDGLGRYVKSKFFEISGLPKIPDGSYTPLQDRPNKWLLPDNSGDTSRFLLFRTAPTILKGIKIGGYLEGFLTTKTLPEIMAHTERLYGGGMFQLRLVDETGKYTSSKTFEIAGFPKVPGLTDVTSPDTKVKKPKKPKAAAVYKVGDVVMHECGHRMTIKEVKDDSLLCDWFDPYGECHQDTFKLQEFEKKRSKVAKNPKNPKSIPADCQCSTDQLLLGGCQCGGA